jgi:uncharacterized protein YqeY
MYDHSKQLVADCIEMATSKWGDDLAEIKSLKRFLIALKALILYLQSIEVSIYIHKCVFKAAVAGVKMGSAMVTDTVSSVVAARASLGSSVDTMMGSVVGASMERVRARSARVTDTVTSVVGNLDSASLSSSVTETMGSVVGASMERVRARSDALRNFLQK